jgi:presenilin-like A22 family membrane protease
MKRNLKIAIILLSIFLITQLLGVYVVNFYLNPLEKIPYGFDNSQLTSSQTPGIYTQILFSFIISLIIAIVLIFFLIKIKSNWIMKIWFFIVVCLALGVTLNVFIRQLGFIEASKMALAIGLLFGYFKVFRRNIIVHNFIEMLIYPGIGAIFALMFNLWVAIIILLVISVYDIIAVWKSNIMMKMANYQIKSVGVFGGLLIPYANKKMKEKIKLLKLRFKDKQIPESVIKKSKIKVNIAVLGGGDMAFPIMAIGVFFKTFQNIPATLFVILFAALGLSYILFFGKKKSYPAMPYLTAGILLGMLVSWLLMKYTGL